MSTRKLLDLVQQQQSAGFPDVAGTQVSANLPVADRLLNELIASYLPDGGRVRTLEVRALADDRFGVRVTLARPRFLPPFNLTMAIDRQPELPASAELVLRMIGAGGLMALAGPAATLLNALPPGVRIDADRIRIDLRALLRQRGLEPVLAFIEELRVNTTEGKVIVSVKARIPPKP